MKWTRCGPNAFLFQFAEQMGESAARKSQAINRHLEKNPPKGLSEFVLGFTNVLLEFETNEIPAPDLLAKELTEAAARDFKGSPRSFEIPIVYNGEDLRRVADLNGLSEQEIARLHSEPVYTVHVVGFAPGFPYLGELNPRLHTPRLANPRPKVRAGSVAIGGQHTGIYTVDSPGGWNIIGHTDFQVFNPQAADADHIFAFKVGDQVKFVPIIAR